MSTNDSEPQQTSLRSLIKAVTTDGQRLVKSQSELAKAEISEASKQVATSSGLFIGAVVLASLGGLFLLITLAWVLVALGLPTWAGFGIVTLLLLVVGGVLALIGVRKVKKVQPPKQAKIEWAKTKAALTGESDTSASQS